MTHVKQFLIKEECIVYDLILERSGVTFYDRSSGDQMDLFSSQCLPHERGIGHQDFQ